MAIPKQTTKPDAQVMHYSVGALIRVNDKYLLIDRVKSPLGFAGIAGHIDEGEDAGTALVREVQEESGLTVTNFKLLLEEELDWNTCSRGVGIHYWYLYECEVKGELDRSISETKSIGWYSIEEIKKLELEPAWKYWFEKLGII